MGVKNVIINDYHSFFGGNRETFDVMSPKIQRIIEDTLPALDNMTVETYNLEGRGHKHTVGNKNRLIIFVNGTSEPNARQYVDIQPMVINGKTYSSFNKTLKGDRRYEPILDDNNFIIAGWNKDLNQVNIYFDLFEHDTEDSYEVFEYILSHVNKYYEDILTESYWNKTKNRAKLEELILREANSYIDGEKRNLQSEISRAERDLKGYHANIVSISNKLAKDMASYDAIDSMPKDKAKKIIDDFDLIVKNEDVEDINVTEDAFEVLTHHLDFHTQNGSVYKGGKFRIRIPLDSNYVKFFSDQGRRGFWEHNDPHPHINGATGTACFGNLASTIAELSSQHEIYALTLLCIDFLKSVNESDPAGNYVSNWDLIEGDGIENSYDDEDTYYCDHCEEHVETSNRAYQNYDERNDSLEDEVYVCDDCLNDHYTWNDDVGEYIGEVYNQIQYESCENCDRRVNEETMEAVYMTYNASTQELSEEIYVCEDCFDRSEWSDDAGVYVMTIIGEEE